MPSSNLRNRRLAATARCEFLLDYEDEEDDDETTTRRRKKPWRFRWPDDFRDEVLARLLDLNQQRAQEERIAGEAAAQAEGGKPKKKASRKKADTKSKADSKQRTIFD